MKEKAQNEDKKKIDAIYQDKISSSELNHFPDNAFTIIILDDCNDGECITDINQYTLNSKQLFIHLPKREYLWKLPSGASGRRLIINDSILETFSPTLKHTFSSQSTYEMIQTNDETYDKFSAEFNAIRKEIHSEMIFPELINARVRLLALMINLWVEEIYGKSVLVHHNNLAFRFHSLLQNYYKTEKSVSFYAKELCITPNYLGVICRKQYKISPLEFIKERIILEAKKLLHSSDKSIKEIAFELGFQNFSHFSYFFRTQTGMTPKNYRSVMDKS
ncbi:MULTISPECIES: helix-turn-helix domain-containing protein [Chryseobacterium]|uniref:helix-turn-helix domain-containing protein n=1 Tax=Chryseobacterium TaxID=59732 RepID=UPI001EF8E991|nr:MULTISPECIES: helix-turn-helix domain-containing protein [Chryseobacterium]MBM7420257.1 AraC-like DNA-binding protein [Chryseobacterium sp. JUb44]MDH6210201.1 AraC family transcriptional activator of pobA [Chryseobacterium sp. BIGb0186]WSO08918.1 helix-turn-helix domain-containing protein [Chryseobacterium scophthalmum]